jgi:hypothetical protein
MEEYADAFAEVYVILGYLDKDDYNKIPNEVLDLICKYKNDNYIFEYNENVALNEQKLLVETKAILYNFFRDYLATPTQREKIRQWQNNDRRKTEIKKKEDFNGNELFPNKNVTKEPIKDTPQNLVTYKENIFKKIIKWFQKFLIRR